MKKSVNQNQNFSVFDNPAEIPRKNPKSGKKRIVVLIVSAFLLLCVVAGVVLATKLIPEKETQNSTGFESFSVMNTDSDNVKSVTVTNKNGTFNFYPQTDTVTNEDSSTSYDVVHWYVKEIEQEKTNTANTESVISAATVVSAFREITKKTASECGFDNPPVTVTVEKTDNKGYTLYVGDVSPDGYGVYIKFKDSEKIYLADEGIIDSFVFDADTLCSTEETGEE